MKCILVRAFCLGLLISPPLFGGQIVINEVMYHPPPAVPEDTRFEWVELYNTGTNDVNLTGWRFSKGINFNFPSNTVLPAGGYLVVAADADSFVTRYPGVANVVGGWTGTLADGGEEIQLEEPGGVNHDSVTYADEGDWGIRQILPDPTRFLPSWEWTAQHDGFGSSLELINPLLSNNSGQNWAASLTPNGTPGQVNSVRAADIAPMILEVGHFPIVPRSSDQVTITARLVDEQTNGLSAILFYRNHSTLTPDEYNSLVMFDDGAHNDGAAGDGLFGTVVQSFPSGTVIEFYVQASDGVLTRTWPAPTLDQGGFPSQGANALYQVDDSIYSGPQPVIRAIMTETERNRLQTINRQSDAQMNATFITAEGTDVKLRYNTGIRIRGAGTRGDAIPNYRVNIPKDRLWNGVSEVNLNQHWGYNQVVGSALLQKSGLVAANARGVQVRVNGVNLASSGLPQFGSYALVEVLNGDWAENHLPNDSAGNIYRASTGAHTADLQYRGTDPQNYINAGYSKVSNISLNDWSDLIQLTSTLTGAPDATYVDDIRGVINVDGWMRYFALFSALTSMETSLATGEGDDYGLYRGLNDTRFIVLPHDLDTIFGQGDTTGNPSANLFRMCRFINPGADTFVMDRFMTNNAFVRVYFRELNRLLATTFSPEELNPLLDKLLTGWVPPQNINAMKQFAVMRNTFIRSQIPTALSITTNLPIVSGYPQTLTGTIALNGRANPVETYSVRVNGALATFVAWQATWSISGVSLNPGINRVLVQALGESGQEIERAYIDIWYDRGAVTDVSGNIVANTVWTAANGPYRVTGNIGMGNGVTLTIQPGTTVYFAPNTGFLIGGTLLAEGTETQRIRFTRQPGVSGTWTGLAFEDSLGSNRIAYADIEFAGGGDSISLLNSELLVDHVSWGGTTRTIIDLANSSIIVRNSVFPTIVDNETIHGVGMPPGGYVIIDGNSFGGTTGYSDIIDFTGGQRPGPIIQILNNVFNGGSDDALDLDGTDAHIEGNVFMNIRQDAPRDSTSNAIATDTGAEVTVVRNIFYQVEHALLLKNGASAVFENNTVYNIRPGPGSIAPAAVINFGEPNRGVAGGAGSVLDGNILWDVESNRLFLNFTNGVMSLTVNHSITPGTNTPGIGNLDIDPHFVNDNTNFITPATIRQALALIPGSPAVGTGPNGLDMGALVPAGASISGEPRSPTPFTSATLTVAGPGITHYRYSLNGGPFGPETDVGTPIQLSGLSNGNYTVRAIGKNSASVWQSESNATASRTWTVDSSAGGVRINEILARNDGGVPIETEFPDLVELQNTGATPIDLSGMGLTDDPAEPFKFKFSDGTVLNPGGYLVLLADEEKTPPGIHLGFGLNQDGDALYLYNKVSAGAGLIDSVVFGPQLPNLSIGRLRQDSWGLAQPTFGSANVAHPLGDERGLRINEWLADAATVFGSDFVELFNPDALPVGLGGLYLTDTPQGAPTLHAIPGLSFIGGGGHIAFIADGEPELGALHLGFRLAPEQGQIGLFNEQTNLIDCIWYGPQTTDISEGRRPSGADTFSFFGPPTQTQPTPGGPNPGAGGIVTVTNITVPLLPLATTWSYESSGNSFDGTGWEQPGFDDSLWPVGAALLAVENCGCLPAPGINTTFSPYNNTQITYYFRKAFVVNTNLDGFTMTLTTVLDDGAVIYLNGAEVLRVRMPPGPIFSFTEANAPSVNNASIETWMLPGLTVPQGTNVIAVEVHQASIPSSDVTWGMALEANRSFTNQPVLLAFNEVMANNVTVTNLNGTNVTDWVELYNPGNSTVNLGGMSLSDDVANPRRWVFPAGVTIPSGGYLVIQCDPNALASTDASGPLNTGFGLGASGDEAYLFDTLARGGALLDGVVFGLQVQDFSIGRVPSGIGEWRLTLPTQGSANIAANLGQVSAVRINEWLANPSGNDDDFFELYNPNPQPVDISGYYLTDNLGTPLQHKIAPLSFIGVDENAFAEFIADGNIANGPNHVSFGLRAAGEAIGFYTPAAVAIDTVTFGAQANGVSEGRFPDGSATIARFPGTASPGRPNLLPLNDIVVSEVLTHTDPPFEDAIELQNLSAGSVDISGWYLTDAKNDPKRFRIPDGTIVPAGGFVTFYEYQFNPDFTGRPPFFSLSSVNGDEVYIYTADAMGNLTGYRSGVSFGAQVNAVSFGRYATSVGFDFTAISARTFGSDNPATLAEFRMGRGLPNAYPLVGPVVISEIMYHPPDNGTNDNDLDEFVELQNISGSAFSLFDTNYPTNTWRLRDAVDFDFPQNITIPAGGFVVVVGFDPATSPAVLDAFRTKHNITAAVPIYGPWQGKLDNSSENVELYKPDQPQLPGTANAGFVPYVLADKVKYADTAPWPVLADGSTANGVGYSLQRRVAADYGNDPVNWIAASPTPGSGTGAAPLTPPSITSLTAAHSLPVGSNDTLTVVAAGAPVLTYQWRFNGSAIPGATNATLSLNNFQGTNAGIYSVTVVNAAGAASASTRVDLRSAPIVNRDPQDVATSAGGTASFSVVASGTPPLAYQWRRNGIDLPGATNAYLLVTNVQPANEGQYRVVITNAFGSVTSSVAVLGIFAPPIITSQPQGTNVFVNTTVSFSVSVSGSPPLRYQWRFNNVNIPGATNSTLTLNNVQVGNGGEYRVFVTNTVGMALSDAATLNVTVPPFVTVVATDGSAGEAGGNTGLFTFSRTGSTASPLTVSFTVGGTAIPGSDYGPLTSPVTIPSGQSNWTVLVMPANDSQLEGDETVTVTVLPGIDYAPGSPASATVVILDDDNQRPSVTLTNPVEGLIINLPATVLLAASASDADGSITKVEFFDNGTNKLGEALSAPYLVAWTNGVAGAHVLTAVATDNLGSTGVSAPVNIILNGAPAVALTSPANNAQFSAPATITLNATATDADGSVALVEFYAGLTLIGSDTNSPFSVIWTNVAVGNYVLTARATDNRGAISASASVAISVVVPPPGFSDSFAARGAISGFTNYVKGNNSTYSTEPGEPRHENRGGTRSAWISWTAPASGTCTMDTLSSSFDTVLSIYIGDTVSTLFKVAGNDDATAAILQSRVSFPVTAGTRYEIAVDGYSAGLGGAIEFHLGLPNPYPIITAQPQSFVVDPGANVVFNVGVGGNGPFTYQWRFNGTNLAGETLTSLTRNNVQIPDQGTYTVVVSNPSGSVTSAPAALSLRLPPSITAQPQTFVADPDGSATFNVTAVGLMPFFYQWRFNGAAIPSATNGSYTRANVQFSEAGLYSVRVTNTLGEALSQDAELMIKPRIISIGLTNGIFAFTAQAMSNRMHAIDVSTNLTVWFPLTTNSSAVVETQWTDPGAGSSPRRMYRLRLVQ